MSIRNIGSYFPQGSEPFTCPHGTQEQFFNDTVMMNYGNELLFNDDTNTTNAKIWNNGTSSLASLALQAEGSITLSSPVSIIPSGYKLQLNDTTNASAVYISNQGASSLKLNAPGNVVITSPALQLFNSSDLQFFNQSNTENVAVSLVQGGVSPNQYDVLSFNSASSDMAYQFNVGQTTGSFAINGGRPIYISEPTGTITSIQQNGPNSLGIGIIGNTPSTPVGNIYFNSLQVQTSQNLVVGGILTCNGNIQSNGYVINSVGGTSNVDYIQQQGFLFNTLAITTAESSSPLSVIFAKPYLNNNVFNPIITFSFQSGAVSTGIGYAIGFQWVPIVVGLNITGMTINPWATATGGSYGATIVRCSWVAYGQSS